MHASIRRWNSRLAIALGAIILALPAHAQQTALDGYDAVSYFASDAAPPQAGVDAHSVEHNGHLYLFATADHAARFEANPGDYAPMFDGLDPGRLAEGARVEGDASTFSVIDGFLFLFENDASRESWLRSHDDVALAALSNWDMGQSDPGARRLRESLDRNIEKHLTKRDIAAAGYDLVTYFPEGGAKPKKGQKKISADYRGVTYRFTSAENLERFKERPTRYEPAYGGWCAYAIAKKDYTKPNPKRFTIQNDRLMLFYDGLLGDTHKEWFKEGAERLEQDADQWWLSESGERPRAAGSSSAQ